MNEEILNRARELLAHLESANYEDSAQTVRDLMAEVERLQSRLRELASAEPVAYELVEFGKDELVYSGWYKQRSKTVPFGAIPLIRRPEMPS